MFDHLFTDPQVQFAFGMAIVGIIVAVTGLIGTVAFALRVSSENRKTREERLTQKQKTDDEIRLLEVKRVNQEEQHRRDLELMQTQVTLEREQQARQQEQDLEKRLRDMLETQNQALNVRLEAIKEERNDLRDQTRKQQADIDNLLKRADGLDRDLLGERRLREDLEGDMADLRRELETVIKQKAQIATELAEALEENEMLRKRVAKMDQMAEDLEAMRSTVAEQQRQIRALEEQANGHNEYDDDPIVETEPT